MIFISFSLHVRYGCHQILQEIKLLLQFNALLPKKKHTQTLSRLLNLTVGRMFKVDTYKCDVVIVLALRDCVTWQAFVRRDSKKSSSARANEG